MRFNLRTSLALAITLLLWSSSYPAIRLAVRYYSPGHIALGRLLVSSLVLAVVHLIMRRPWPQRRHLPAIAAMGFIGFSLYHVALNYGEITVSAGISSFIINTQPVWTIMLAAIFLHERLTPRAWLGVAISLTGIALIAYGGSIGKTGGVKFSLDTFILLFASVCASIYLIIQKPHLQFYHAFDLTAYIIWAGTFFLLPFLPGIVTEMRNAPPAATWSLVYLGIFSSTIGYCLWSYVVAQYDASRVIVFLYVVSPLSLLTAWLWLGEIPPLISIYGGLVAMAGVVVANARRIGPVPEEM